MKFSCLQENLSKGLQTVSRAVPTKSSLPILSNVLIIAENGRLKLCATNLETTIITHVGASVEKEGSITIPARLIKEFIINLSPNTITAHLEGETLHISSQKTKTKFNGTSAGDYPELPTFPSEKKYLELDPKAFNAAVSVVAFASGADESRPIFTGVFLSHSENKLTIASTDGFRLSEKVIKVEGKAPDFSTIIPAKTLLEVARIFSTSVEPLKFALGEDENMAFFESEDTLVATRILDGQYPDYKKIVPKETILSASVLAEEFLEAVKLTNIFAKESNSTIRIRFGPESTIKIISLSEETGHHESNLDGEVEGETMEIAFNSKYLLDFLNNVKSERITFVTNGNVSPCLIKPEDHEDFIHIIMPIQL